MLRSGLCRALSGRSAQKPPPVSTSTAPWGPAAPLTPSERPSGKDSYHAGRSSLIPTRAACSHHAQRLPKRRTANSWHCSACTHGACVCTATEACKLVRDLYQAENQSAAGYSRSYVNMRTGSLPQQTGKQAETGRQCRSAHSTCAPQRG